MSIQERRKSRPTRARRSAQSELEVHRQFALKLVSLTELDDLLWYVAESVVGELGYPDCVIYRLDSDGETLVQAAAIGDKTPERRRIKNALKIPVGKGITGHTAATRKPTLIADTRHDARYIHDLMEPGSEACVPILHGNDLLGVLDSEHPEPGWFDEQDIDTLTAVAALASAQWKQCDLIESLRATTQRLERAEREADAANQAKSDFLANMSHEVRTPLNGISGCLDILGDQLPDQAQQAVIDRAHRSTSDLVGLIDNMLDFSRIEAHSLKINSSPSRISDLASYCRETFPRMAGRSGLAFRLRAALAPGLGHADLPRIKQVINNLVSNAIKFTDAGSISLSLEWAPGDDLMLSVADTGVGMDPQTQQRIFNRFVIADESRSRRHGGAGLGLAIARNLIELMHGTIELASSAGRGSTFVVRIPIDHTGTDAAGAPEQAGAVAIPDLSGQTVLIAEDSETNAYIATHHLQRGGARILRACDGFQAVDIACNQPLDAILMDVSMPGMDGLEASRQIRQRSDLSSLPIIALTAHVGADDVHACYAAGMTDYLSKPINRAKLYKTLSLHLMG